MKLLPLLMLPAWFLTGCIINDQKPRITTIKAPTQPIKSFILIGDDEYAPDMTVACAHYGLQVRPMAFQHSVIERQSSSRTIKYNEAGDRYALKMTVRREKEGKCVFSDGRWVLVTVAVVDTATNETLLVITQEGPTRECPPLTPVWDLLAKLIAAQV